MAVEVCDEDGRLRSVCNLLREHGFRVTVERQRSGTVDGYRMVIPLTLRLFYVYAVRARSSPRLRQDASNSKSNSMIGKRPRAS